VNQNRLNSANGTKKPAGLTTPECRREDDQQREEFEPAE
jgi:hypothetical protein